MPLLLHPDSRVLIPDVSGVRELSQRRFDVIPTALVVKTTTHELRDEGTAPASAGSPIQLRDQLGVERYV